MYRYANASINFEALFKNSPNPYVLLSPLFTIVEMNEAYLRVTMRRREEIIGRNMFDAFPGTSDERGMANAAQLRESLERALQNRQTDHIPLIHYDIARPDGSYEERYWSATHTPLLNETGEVAFVLQHTVDVTELHNLRRADRAARMRGGETTLIEGDILKRAQAVQEANEALSEQHRHLRRLVEQAPGFTAILRGPCHVFEMANAAYLELIGNRDIIGRTVRDALPEIAQQEFLSLLDNVYRTGQPYVGRGVRALLEQEAFNAPVERFLDFVYQPIFDADGSTIGIFVQGNDITEQKRAEDELRQYRDHLESLVVERTRALEESEAQRRQAQKMEAVGQLTGGVAHDFNNLLAIIIGNAELAHRRARDPNVQRLLENVLQAGERGAKLTRQLLAFARKQPLSLESTDIPHTIAGMQDLFARTLGPSIRIETELAGDLWSVVTDRNQLEIALLNLAINARDAMPSGGVLTISAANIEPQDLPKDLAIGDYVRIAVRDTGSGIPEGIRTKVFEPFFTTKAIGKGTGLGLSQIYGFVKQQGGSVTLQSETGAGTEVALYLPRTQLQPAHEEIKPPLKPGEGEGAHVLVVDDEFGVRSLVVESLRICGYRVAEAENGAQGVEMLRRHPDIALVVADFAMPVLDGIGFIETARIERPHVPILLMTGYADAERLTQTRLKDVPLILKPFNIDTLLATVAENMNGNAAIQEPAA